MKLDRLPHETGLLMDFFEDGLTQLGALCSRPWHDRLEVVAEGDVARWWNETGALASAELEFAPVAGGTREAGRQVFPGSPLTFRLADALRPAPMPLERAVLAPDPAALRPPDAGVVESLWRSQFPGTVRWRQTAPLVRDRHCSVVAVVRCEIQAIDQHWSLHRLALSLPGGESDEPLARDLGAARLCDPAEFPGAWPKPDPTAWSEMIRRAVEREVSTELAEVRERQSRHLRREIERIDRYFEGYEQELRERSARSSAGKLKLEERLAAARAESVRHRADQAARHEIVIIPHIDAILLVAEPAWRAALQVEHAHESPQDVTARYVPRRRRWVRTELPA